MLKNKKGWIKIIEAFLAILLIAGAALIIINKNQGFKIEDTSKKIYELELNVLREIQLNSSLRNDVLSKDTLPVNWTDFPLAVKNHINDKMSISNLDCEGKICGADSSCEGINLPEKNIYVQRVIISANLTDYKLRQIKLFCWRR